MLSFDYTAIDRQGNTVRGQIQAASRDEAALDLTRTGLLVSKLDQSASGPVSQVQPIPRPASQAPPTRQVQPQATVNQSAPPLLKPNPVPQQARSPLSKPQRASYPRREPVRTKRYTDKQLYLLFSQLQSYARSGQNPVEALGNLSNTFPRQDYRVALKEAADAAKEGRPISDAFERYVDLFPPHTVGMIRAAEHGGFFPEAYDLLTDQAHASHKFRIWFVWLLAVAIMVAGCLPIMVVFLRGALDSWDAQEKSGGTANGWSTFLGGVWHEFLWPGGPIILVLVIGCWLFAKFWQSMPNRERRHRFTMLVPSVNKRARAESLSVFAWTMGMLSKVGLSPKTVWELSVNTIPNLEIRRGLEETGRKMSEQTRLSEAMSMSHQLPEEYAPIVQTGEITGDVPGALIRASQSQLEEFKVGDQGTKARVGCWMLLLVFIGSAIMFGLFYGGFYPALFKKISGE